ncbi:MAG: dihydrolipoyl dehydrogenase [Bdellovibrionaceae bacterium]|nr:dihydrolipoyl dehydrogenase [Pseudobdellovibrionaceae bacterium]
MKHYDVVIVGAGTAGLSARREVAKKTDNYIVIDDGPLGTTCARVGCMPSKVLIQVANDFDRRKKMQQMGIHGGENLSVNAEEVMAHVRSLRDRFVRAVKNPMADWEHKLVRKRATFVDAHTLDLGDEQIKADKIILATGSRPIIPAQWEPYKEFLIDTDQFFELSMLPKSMAVIGLGVIGIELGQALHRLGVNMVGITMGKAIGGITDPQIQDYIAQKFSEEMPMHFNGAEILGTTDDKRLRIKADDRIYEVEKAFVAIGRRANLDRIGIDKLGLALNKAGVPDVDINTMKVKSMPHILIPGDANADRPILHEAADEGVMAGYNAVNPEQCFKRRVNLGITFSDPNIAATGKRYEQLVSEKKNFVTGRVSFEGQGRSIVKLKEQGVLHVYADEQTGEILGAEMQAPDGEHVAHLLAWAISVKLNVFEALKLPFYHPVIEEGLRTALRDAASKIKNGDHGYELMRCNDVPIR